MAVADVGALPTGPDSRAGDDGVLLGTDGADFPDDADCCGASGGVLLVEGVVEAGSGALAVGADSWVAGVDPLPGLEESGGDADVAV